MKKILFLFIALISASLVPAVAQGFIGTWTPDKESSFGEIQIKKTAVGKYKMRISLGGKVHTSEAENSSKGVLYFSFEENTPTHGDFWVSGKEILEKEEERSCSSSGDVSGFRGPRGIHANICKDYIDLKIIIVNQDEMYVYYKLRGEYLKGSIPLFFQESNWSPNPLVYTKW
ncbi:MAG: hypothetical protein NC338_07210 [Firmicutes bacterium]|nr:hypothetical protein [Bacillota bacterium]MCM1401783.1 hypothetical protein [Bacteroides sp.]MCM1477651.1 hypothetical protein [Bacteroides sp.]